MKSGAELLVTSPPPRSSELWRAVFRMPLIDWVSDFLFATDGTTNASILLSPLQATHSQLMSTVASSGGDGGVGDAVIASHWLLLPAFSVAGVSVGLVVVEDTAATPRLMRYVRCDDTGDTLLVGDASDGQIFEVEFVSYDSPRRSTRAYCQFAGELRDHLRSRKGGVYVDDAVVRRCLLSSLVLQESRASCANCPVSCSCRFSFRRARHPLDFAFTAPNALPLLGDFRGFGRTLTFDFGRILETSTITTELQTTGGGEVGCTERLRFWAAQYCLGQGKPNPMMLEMPSAESEAMVDRFLVTDDEGEKKDEVPVVKSEKVAENGIAHVTVDDIGSSVTGTSGQREVIAEETEVEISSLYNPDVSVAVRKKVKDQEGTELSTVTMPDAKSNASPRMSVSQASVPILGTVQPSTSTTPIVSARSILAVPSMPPLLHVVTPAAPTTLAYHAPTMHSIQPALVGLPQKRGWIAIAPSATVQPSVEQYSSAERRKILKREAAARSNAKRREVVALQRKLTKARAKVETLRKRERQLRDENMQLRARGNADTG